MVKRTTTEYIGYALGVGTAGLAVAQMVSFEEFVEALQQYHVATYGWTVALGLLLIGLAVGAVPFLLKVRLHKIAWAFSAICVLLLPLAWTLMTVLAMMLDRTVGNAGYLGGFVDVPVGGFVLVLDLLWLAISWLWFGKIGGKQAMRIS